MPGRRYLTITPIKNGHLISGRELSNSSTTEDKVPVENTAMIPDETTSTAQDAPLFRREQPATPDESPFAHWWSDHHLDLNEILLATAGQNVSRAVALRRLLREVADGKLPIDDPRLRGVVGQLVRDPIALASVQKHRLWQSQKTVAAVKTIGGRRES